MSKIIYDIKENWFDYVVIILYFISVVMIMLWVVSTSE